MLRNQSSFDGSTLSPLLDRGSYSNTVVSCLVENHTFGYLFMNLTKNFDDVSIFEKIRNFDDFSGFCSPEFDSFVRDLTIF